jgi:hypothetical protein
MTLTLALILLALLSGLVLSALASGTETGAYCLNRVRLSVRRPPGVWPRRCSGRRIW